MNNKGFMMAEVIVVAAIILVGMGALYKSYNSIIVAYNKRISYYDTATLYALGDFRDDHYADVGTFSSGEANGQPLTNNPVGGYRNIVYLINISGGSTANITSLANSSDLNKTFKDYLNYITRSVKFKKNNHLLVMERCHASENNDCRYAYLEVEVGG